MPRGGVAPLTSERFSGGAKPHLTSGGEAVARVGSFCRLDQKVFINMKLANASYQFDRFVNRRWSH